MIYNLFFPGHVPIEHNFVLSFTQIFNPMRNKRTGTNGVDCWTAGNNDRLMTVTFAGLLSG